MRAAPLVTLILLIVAFFANRRRKKPATSIPAVLEAQPQDARVGLGAADWRVRKQSIVTLAANYDPGNIPAFVQSLADIDNDVRTAARQALVSCGDAAVPALAEQIRSVSWQPAEQAAQVLGDIGGSAAVRALETGLAHRSAWVRTTAARALGALRAGESVPALIAALSDEDADVREAVAQSLRHIGTPDALEALNA